MSALAATLQALDTTATCIIYGYMRRLHKQLDIDKALFRVIPEGITLSVLKCYINDRFEIKGMFTEISDDTQTVFKTMTNGYNSSYGKMCIPSKSNMICKWTVEIDGITLNGLAIGISSYCTTCQRFYTNTQSANYAFCANGGTYTLGNCDGTVYDAILKSKDQFSIQLDLKHKTIEYFINHKSKGIVHQNIKIGKRISYRLAISISHYSTTVTLKQLELL